MIIRADSLEQAIEKITLEPDKLNQFTLVIDTRPKQLELFSVKVNDSNWNNSIAPADGSILMNTATVPAWNT
jgi:hypothetical protein